MTTETKTIVETELDPAIVQYFEQKYAPVVSKRDELLSKNSTLKSELDALGGLDAIKSLKAKADAEAQAAEQARLAALSKDGKISELEQHFTNLLAQKDEKLTKFQQNLINKEVDAALAAAIAAEEGSALLLSPHLRSRVSASIDDDGNVKIVVKGKAGETVGEDGKPLTLQSLVVEAKSNPDFAAAFKAHQASGAGSRKSSGTSSGKNPFAKNTENITEQVTLINTNPALAEKLAQEAGIKKFW